MAPSSNYEGGGEVGGKWRKRLLKRPSTPYDRPSTATPNPSWISKLLRLGPTRFFANKRLPPPPPHTPEEQEGRNGLQETALNVKINDGVKKPVGGVCGTSSSNNDTSGLPELEKLLKNKIFTRSEVDRLTELLKSRALDLPVEDDGHGFKLYPSGQDSERHPEFPTTLNVNKSERLGAHGAVLDSTFTTREQNMQQHLDDKVASPTELAKAYMSSRPNKVSPSALGLRTQITREHAVSPRNPPYASKSELASLSVKTSGYSDIPDNGYTTPRSLGRAAIYSVARTPYSRYHPITHQKVCGSKSYGDLTPALLTSRSPLENGGQVALKPMTLKRRSTVLDDDIGSIGPIRRIRQKHNLLHHRKSVTNSLKGMASDADIKEASTSSASYAHVPRESSEMAAKILQHLEKMTPKQKSLESKLATARERRNIDLTPQIRPGQALRTMDLDELKLLRDSHKDNKLVDQPVSCLAEYHDITTQRQGSIQEQGSVNSVLPDDNGNLDKTIHGNLQNTGGTKNPALEKSVNGNLREPPSLAFSPMATNTPSSVEAPSNKLVSNDGPLTSSLCLPFSSSGPASFDVANQSFTQTSSNMASSTGATTSTAALTDSVHVTANGASSSLSERVSEDLFSKERCSAPATIGSTEDFNVKAEKVNNLGNFNNLPTESIFAGRSTVCGIFGVGTSAASSAINSQWPSSASGTSVSKESSLSGSGSPNVVSLSTPVQFRSSSSTMGSGASVITPLTSSISVSSSLPVTKPEGVIQSFKSASASNPVISINGSAPVTFKFGGGASGLSNGKDSVPTPASAGSFQLGASSATPTSSGTSLFSFSAGSSASSSAISSSSTAPGVFSIGAGYSSSAASVSTSTSGECNIGSVTPVFSSATPVSSTTSAVFTFGITTSISSSSNAMASNSSTASPIFSFGASAPAPSPDSNKICASGPNFGAFASSLQAPESSFVPPFTMPSSTGFSYGSSSPFGSSNSSMVFGSSNGVPSNPTPSIATTSALPSAGMQSVFNNSAYSFSTTPSSNDQKSTKDCMAEDQIQSSAPATSVFGQSLVTPQSLISPSPPSFLFASTAPSAAAPFQFASQQNQVGQQPPSQFQASGSSEFNVGGKFSLGSSDKPGRKFVKISKSRNRKLR